MVPLIKDIWQWLTTQAFHQLLVLLLVSVLAFIVLLKYPIEFERVTYTVKDFKKISDKTEYILRTTVSDDGAKVILSTKTYYAEVQQAQE